MIAEFAACAAVIAEQADGSRVFPAGDLEGVEDIRAVARGREHEQPIAIVEEGVALSGKNILVAVVVGDAGEGGGVGVEADRARGGAIVAIATDEFLGQMQGLGGRAPVAAGVERPAAIENQGDDSFDL